MCHFLNIQIKIQGVLCWSFSNLLHPAAYSYQMSIYSHTSECVYSFPISYHVLKYIPFMCSLPISLIFLLYSKEMHKAAAHEIKAELECGKKQKSFSKSLNSSIIVNSPLSLSSSFLCNLVSMHLIFLPFLYKTSFFLSFPRPFPWRNNLYHLVALTQHNLAKLNPTEKLEQDYLHDIQNEMSSWKDGAREIPEDQAQITTMVH